MQSLMLRDDQSRSPEERPRPDRPRSDCPVLLSQRWSCAHTHTEDIDALPISPTTPPLPPWWHACRIPIRRKTRRLRATHEYRRDWQVRLCHHKSGQWRVLGSARVEPNPADDTILEMGYWLGEPYWNKGYATEAAHALIDMAFRTREWVSRIDATLRESPTSPRAASSRSPASSSRAPHGRQTLPWAGQSPSNGTGSTARLGCP